MKVILNLVFLVAAIPMFSQNLDCCKTLQDVEHKIAGEWKLKGISNNLTYRFSFTQGHGIVEVLEELNLPPKAEQIEYRNTPLDTNPSIYITVINNVFFMNIKYHFGAVSEPISELSEARFVYGETGFEHVFVRDKN